MMRRASTSRRPRGERRGGFAMALVLAVVVSAFVLAMGFLFRASVRLAGSDNYVRLAKVRSAAESGLEHAKHVLVTAPESVGSITFAAPSGPYVLDGNVMYRFYFAATGTSGAYTAYGLGTCGSASHTASATLQAQNTYATTVKALSPTYYWRLGETAGTLCCDEMKAKNGWYINGVALGGASCLVGDTNPSAYFDGTNDYANIGNIDVNGSAVTLAAWVKMDPGAVNVRFIIDKPSALVYGHHFWGLGAKTSGSQVRPFFTVRTTSGGETVVGSGVVPVGQWTFLVGVYDGANVILYQDGVERGRTPLTGTILTGSANVWIGGNSLGDPTMLWRGSVDEMAVFQTALTAAQVQSLYAARRPQLTILSWND